MSTPSRGIFLHNHTIATDPAAAVEIAVRAEELGYDSVWAAEHVVLPSPRVRPSPMEPEDPIADPLVLLAHLAARTERVLLGTGVLVLPQRNPLVLAKQLATLDVLSRGRLVVGVGAGYLEPELTAIGVPMAERGARTDAYLAAMRSLWEDEKPHADGPFVSFSGVDAHPRPVQRPLPVVIGGESPAAWRRTARFAQGWYGFRLSPDEVVEQVAGLRRAMAPLPQISVTPSLPLDDDAVAAYTRAGVDRLIVAPRPDADLPWLRRWLERHAPA
ncbi:LLM class F420-dependent oxidoreductase [Pseudonocardia sp. CA-107938]|uniref:LLM class F420-dependent oxidoreductase n=1 Tax=Pseudonocardia sp. CA-107938 TaxID=3240021 RepID=UPI003D8A40FD